MNPQVTSFIVVAVCVPLTLFFSLAVHSLRRASWIRLEDAFDEINKPYRFITLRDDFERFMSAMEILRLVCNLTIVSGVIFAMSFEKDTLSASTVIYGCFFCVILLSLFSVVIPNAWARYGGTAVLVRGYSIIRAVEVVIRPVIAILHLIYPIAGKIAGKSEDENGNNEERQERLLSVMEEGEQRGVVDEEEKEMIVSVLEFRETTAGEIMTPRTDIIGIPINASLTEVAGLINENGYSRYPVYDQSIDHIVAILYSKDLIGYVDSPDEAFDINKLLRKPLFVPESKCLRDLLHDFQNQKVHIAVVLDEYGGTAGVVTFEDILEELVGEIIDEHEPPREEMVKQLEDKTFEIDARFSVDELNDEYDLELPEDEDYETVGGFIFAQLGHIPKQGEEFVYKNMKFTVINAQSRKIDRIKLEILPPQNGSSS